MTEPTQPPAPIEDNGVNLACLPVESSSETVVGPNEGTGRRPASGVLQPARNLAVEDEEPPAVMEAADQGAPVAAPLPAP